MNISVSLISCLCSVFFVKKVEASGHELSPEKMYRESLEGLNNFRLNMIKYKDISINFINKCIKGKPLYVNSIYDYNFKNIIEEFTSLSEKFIDELHEDTDIEKNDKKQMKNVRNQILNIFSYLSFQKSQNNIDVVESSDKYLELKKLFIEFLNRTIESAFDSSIDGKWRTLTLSEKAENPFKESMISNVVDISNLFNTIYIPKKNNEGISTYYLDRYVYVKNQKLNWTMLVNYLLDDANKFQKNLYKKGSDIFTDIWQAFIDRSITLFKNSEKLQESNIPFNDKYLLQIFFSKLYQKIFIRNKNHNSLDLYAKIVATTTSDYRKYPVRNFQKFDIKATQEIIKKLITKAELVFNIKCDLEQYDKKNSLYEITFKKTQKKIKLTILHQKTSYQEEAVVLDEDQNTYVMSADNRWHLHSLLHDFAKIIYHACLDLDELNNKKIILFEFYPLLIEANFNETHSFSINYDYSTLSILTFLYSFLSQSSYDDDNLSQSFYDNDKFKETYTNAFSKDHQKLLHLMKKKNNDFNDKIQEVILNEINVMIGAKEIEHLLAEILTAYCHENKLKNFETIREKSITLGSLLEYLDINIRDLADYAYELYFNQYSTGVTGRFSEERMPLD